MKKALVWASGILCLAGAEASLAERPDNPAYRSHRYDEDYRYLADQPAADFWDPLKYVHLPGIPGGYLSIGGELRERFEAVRHPDFGIDPGSDHVFLHRLLLHGDFRLGTGFRGFLQLGSFQQTGRHRGSGSTDVDRLDLVQGFADASFNAGETGRATLRAGRQEMSFGSSRLVSVRESPNIRRAFDGGRAFIAGNGYRVDAFFVRPVMLKEGVFDDETDQDLRFWGLYGTGALPGAAPLKADLYYFNYSRDGTRFAAGTAAERRQTVGARLFGEAAGWDWDIEGAFQFGSFGSGHIRAWTVASDTGFTFADLPLSPRLGLKADIASGDGDADDRRLGTFNPLFPKLPYFSEAGLIAPANIVDLRPSLSATPHADVQIELGLNVLWRHRSADAFYAPPLQPVQGTRVGNRYIGSQAIAGMEWSFDRHLSIAAGYVRFFAGDTIRQAGGKDVDFVYASAAYKF